LTYIVAAWGFWVVFGLQVAVGDKRLGIFGFIELWVLIIALTIPTPAITVRRLHDINLSGWWILLPIVVMYAGKFVPYGDVVLFTVRIVFLYL